VSPEDAGGATDFVLLGIPDVNGALRGKALSRKEFDKVVSRGYMPLSSLVFALDPCDVQVAGLPEFGLSSGAPDVLVRPELETFAGLSWRPGWGICIGTPLWQDGSPCGVSPRVVLQQVLAAAEGVLIRAAFEYEVRVWHAGTQVPMTGGLQYNIADAERIAELTEAWSAVCEGLGIDLEVVHTEGGPGLIEFNVSPRDGVRAADEAILLKVCFKQLAARMGLFASFLAKPVAGEEGSGGHLHLSLWEADGSSTFARGPMGQHGITASMEASISGLLRLMPAMSLVYNPTINSYKRVVGGLFAPVNASWGLDNRSTAVRAIVGTPESTRLEIRRPGADSNPYLVLAAAAGSIADGLRQRTAIDPPISGDASTGSDTAEQAPLPNSLEEALVAFASDSSARSVLGEEFSSYFVATRRWEVEAWQKAVSQWERERYEQIV
jgi:glutamine synthetase